MSQRSTHVPPPTPGDQLNGPVPRLSRPAKTLPTDRRASALIALLALEGTMPRSRLAGLLWPDVSETVARNNLSQTLRRLRHSGGPQVQGAQQLRLDTPLGEEDALALLAAHDYDDLTDLSDLLLALREQRIAARLGHYRAELERAERRGDMGAALDLCTVLLDLDPFDETTQRSAMRLHHLLGDRAGALAIYHHWTQRLQRELQLTPAPETVALAHEIARSPAPTPAPPALPLSVQRPPRLIGCEQLWNAVIRSWEGGRAVILSGEPGAGKTRLMQDLVATHGPAAWFEGRPGDGLAPYSTLARAFRGLLRRFPALDLPQWVRHELARIVPEFGAPPGPLSAAADRLRFYQASAETLRLALGAGLRALVFDDLQFADAASVEACQHAFGAIRDEKRPPHVIYAHRSGALNPVFQTSLADLVAAGLATPLEFAPLQRAEMEELLTSLEVPRLAGQAVSIALVSGGNPLYALEAARQVLTAAPALPLSQQIQPIIQERLRRLSRPALQLARAAAVLGSDLTPETAAHMLDCDALALAGPWAELEAAQILAGGAFTHDLLAEAALAALPDTLCALLHRRAAAALETVQAAPARIAQHWQAGNEPGQAGRHWLDAAGEAHAHFRLDEAAALYGAAAGAFEAAQQIDAAVGALEHQSNMLLETDYGAQHEGVVVHLEALARTPLQQARAHLIRAQLQNRQRQPAQAETSARQGLLLLRAAPQPELEASLLGTVALSQWAQGQLEAAAETYAQVAALFAALDRPTEQADTINDLAMVLDYLARRQEAARRYAQVERLFAQTGQTDHQAVVLGNWGGSLLQGGRAIEAVERFEQALALCAGLRGAPNIERRIRTQLGGALLLLERYREAQTHLERALHLARTHGLPQTYAHSALGDLWASLGRFRAAQLEFAAAQLEPRQGGELALVLLGALRARVLAGRRPVAALIAREHQIQTLLEAGGPVTNRLRWQLWQARVAAPEAGLALATQALADAQALDHGGLLACAHTRAGQALLALARPTDALVHARQACALLETYRTLDLPLAEAWAVNNAALLALGDPAAGPQQAALRTHLLDVADQHVLPAHRAAFLAIPSHQAVLSASQGTPPWRRLTDAQWARVAPVLGDTARGTSLHATGRPRRETRAVLDGVLWALQRGAAWSAPFPEGLPSAATCYRRYRSWKASGALHAVLVCLRDGPDGYPSAPQLLQQLEAVPVLKRGEAPDGF